MSQSNFSSHTGTCVAISCSLARTWSVTQTLRSLHLQDSSWWSPAHARYLGTRWTRPGHCMVLPTWCSLVAGIVQVGRAAAGSRLTLPVPWRCRPAPHTPPPPDHRTLLTLCRLTCRTRTSSFSSIFHEISALSYFDMESVVWSRRRSNSVGVEQSTAPTVKNVWSRPSTA